MPGSILPFQLAPSQQEFARAVPMVRQSAARITVRREPRSWGKPARRRPTHVVFSPTVRHRGKCHYQTNCEKRAWRHCRQLRRSRQAAPGNPDRSDCPTRADALARGARVWLGVRPPFRMPRWRREGTALTISRPQNCGAVSRRPCN
jgi:hypothetical protein